MQIERAASSNPFTLVCNTTAGIPMSCNIPGSPCGVVAWGRIIESHSTSSISLTPITIKISIAYMAGVIHDNAGLGSFPAEKTWWKAGPSQKRAEFWDWS